MKIETKYDIGQKMWVLYAVNNEVRVYEDEIIEIVINSSRKVLYFGVHCAEEIPEEQIILYEDTAKLVQQIKNLST